MGDRTEYFREYKRAQRAEARKKGLCIICTPKSKAEAKRRGYGIPREGNVTCDDCQQRANALNALKQTK